MKMSQRSFANAFGLVRLTFGLVGVLLLGTAAAQPVPPTTAGNPATAAGVVPQGLGRTGQSGDALGPAYLDQVIEPDEYRVGPGDIIFVNLWTSRPEQFELEITPEASTSV